MISLFVFAMLLGVVGIGVMLMKPNGILNAKMKPVAGSALLVLCVVFGVISCIRTVPTGHTGIVTSFGKVENYTLEAGVHFAAPWQEVVNMDNRNQKGTATLKCFSSDIQEVEVLYSLNFQINKQNAQEIYKTIGEKYYDTVVNPRIQEAVRSVIALYTAEELLEKRSELSEDIKEILTSKLSTYNIEVLDTALENLDFSDAFTDAVEAKQVAAQKKQQAEIEQQQALMEAEFAKDIAETKAQAEAQVAVIAAEADKEVVKIQADAAEYAGQKDAAIISQVRDALAKDPENLTDEDINSLLVYYYILQWNGELPETYIGTEDFYAMLTALASKANASNSSTSNSSGENS